MALLSSALRVTGRASSLSFSPRGRAFSQISDLVTSLQSLRLAKEVFTLDANQSVGAAALHLAKHGLTFAMVGDEKGQVVGMLGEQEILGFVAKTGDVATANVLLGSSAATQPIKRWMTPANQMQCVKLDDPLDAALRMIRHRTYRHLPVLDYWGNLHSVLDIRDVLKGVEGAPASWHGKTALDVLGEKRRAEIEAIAAANAGGASGDWRAQLGEYLRRSAKRHTILATASVQKAAEQMQRERLTFLVALRQAPNDATKGGAPRHTVAGLLTERSFLHFASEWEHGKRTLDVTTCKEVDAATEEAKTVAHTEGTVSGVMTPLENVLHVSLADDATKIVDIFFSKNVTHLPVIDRQNILSGIISVRDLLRPHWAGGQ